MAMSDAERARNYRLRNGQPAERKLEPCGTRAAAARHTRNGEPLCPACLEARRKYHRERARERRKRS